MRFRSLPTHRNQLLPVELVGMIQLVLAHRPVHWSKWKDGCILCGLSLERGCPACDPKPLRPSEFAPSLPETTGRFTASVPPPALPSHEASLLLHRSDIERHRHFDPLRTAIVHNFMTGRTCAFRCAVSDEPGEVIRLFRLSSNIAWNARFCLVLPTERGIIPVASNPGRTSIVRWGDVARSRSRPILHLLHLPRSDAHAVSSQVAVFYRRNMVPPPGMSWSTAVRSDLEDVSEDFPADDTVQVAFDHLRPGWDIG